MPVRHFDPHAARTTARLAEHLARHLPATGRVLELASGTGQRVVELAARFPTLTWQPSEREPAALASIAAWCDERGLPNVLPPIRLDVRDRPWPDADVVLAVRLAHVLPLADLPAMFGGPRVIVVGPLADQPAPAAPAVPPHLAHWMVPIRIPTRDELVAAAGGPPVHTEVIDEDTLLVFDALSRRRDASA